MDYEKRKAKLLDFIGNNTECGSLIDEIVFLESRLDELRRLPMIRVHPSDSSKQKATPAAKQYKEFLQQYINIIRTLYRITGADETEETSPLREWMAAHSHD